MTDRLSRLSAIEVLAAFDDGSLSPVAYAEAVADRIEATKELNAVQSFERAQLLRDAARAAEARRAGRAGHLAGLPYGAKDNLNSTSYPTSGGTRALLNHVPKIAAGAVRRLGTEGAILAAKLGMHELAFGPTSDNAVTGPVRNPHDPALIAGGSSGGSGAAVAAGIFPVALGTDTGGSCRIPASLCGTVGFRPTTGRYPGDGAVPISRTRDTVGTFARNVDDIAMFDRVLTGDETPLAQVDLRDVTIGIPQDRYFEDLDPHVETHVGAQIGRLRGAGARLVEVSFPGIWEPNEAFSFPVVLYEVTRGLRAYLAEHAPTVTFEELEAAIGSPDVAGAFASQRGPGAIDDGQYRRAIDEHHRRCVEIYAGTFARHGLDAIVFPTTPIPARPVGQNETVELNGRQVPTFPTYIRNTDLTSNVGVPGISLPCPVGEGLPVGLELDGIRDLDRRLLAIAHAVEAVMNHA